MQVRTIINNPTHIKINNNVYELNTDFRNWIAYERLWEDERIDIMYKMEHLLKLAFVKPPDEDYQEIFKAALYFYLCGTTVDKEDKKTEFEQDEKQKDIFYDYTIDRQRIKSSFMKSFGFSPWNLAYFHWWDFKACFDHLVGSTFENMVEIRTLDTSQYKGVQRAKMNKLKEKHKILSKEDKEKQDFLKNFRSVENIEDIIKGLSL